MAEGSRKGWKTMWEKEKLLVTSNFSFSLSVFKRLVQQTRKTTGIVWESGVFFSGFQTYRGDSYLTFTEVT